MKRYFKKHLRKIATLTAILMSANLAPAIPEKNFRLVHPRRSVWKKQWLK